MPASVLRTQGIIQAYETASITHLPTHKPFFFFNTEEDTQLTTELFCSQAARQLQIKDQQEMRQARQ